MGRVGGADQLSDMVVQAVVVVEEAVTDIDRRNRSIDARVHHLGLHLRRGSRVASAINTGPSAQDNNKFFDIVRKPFSPRATKIEFGSPKIARNRSEILLAVIQMFTVLQIGDCHHVNGPIDALRVRRGRRPRRSG